MYRPPVLKGTLGIADDVEHFKPRKRPSHIVVSLVPVLLQINESGRYPDDLVLQWQAVQTRTKSRGDATACELARHCLHNTVIEGSAKAVAECAAVVSRHETPGGGIDQQVKQRMVGRRHAPAQACLLRSPILLGSKEPSAGGASPTADA